MMDLNQVILILVFANTIAIMFALVMIAIALVRTNTEISKFIDIDMSLKELTKVIEQHSRMLEYLQHSQRHN